MPAAWKLALQPAGLHVILLDDNDFLSRFPDPFGPRRCGWELCMSRQLVWCKAGPKWVVLAWAQFGTGHRGGFAGDCGWAQFGTGHRGGFAGDCSWCVGMCTRVHLRTRLEATLRACLAAGWALGLPVGLRPQCSIAVARKAIPPSKRNAGIAYENLSHRGDRLCAQAAKYRAGWNRPGWRRGGARSRARLRARWRIWDSQCRGRAKVAKQLFHRR